MTDTPLAPAPLTGKSLFSLHYLETRLPGHPEWAEDAQTAYAAVGALWQKAQQYGVARNEAQTEEEFIKPVLAVLGWSYIPQAKNRRNGRIDRPDYALFGGETAKNDAYPYQGQDDAFYSRALAIAEAKYWGRPLSRKDASGRNTWKTDNNPSHQMVSYLVGTRCAWGILTNGQVWRLYSREVSSTASEYYEIDLAAVFSPADAPTADRPISDFKRFWLFFRRAAFTPDGQGRSFIQRIHEGSATYAREISDKLKELVFEEVMPEIAAGFVAYRRQQMGIVSESEESLRQIYQASLSLLYKLLFVLYAEARSLLPIANPAYWEESLTRMARYFAERIDHGLAISDATHATGRYESLLALFRRIDQGDPSLGVPRYDGGLFNPGTPDNQFLAGHKLSDRAVARAVDILVRDAGQPVDYAYISVRNLGSIYEGLLENRLVIVDGGTKTKDESASVLRPSSSVILLNDKGERKASGSYYTPDYIVDYIVRHTLEPILEERSARFSAAMDRIADLRRQLARSTINSGQVNVLRPQLEAAERDAREAFLGIKVCDPGMGSAHFLVNAVDFLTDGIIRLMQAYHDAHPKVPWEWNPIQQLIERVRGDIVADMARQGIALDASRLDDTSLLTRLVLKRCIYGVDLNPMAVELAKLSLWLHSFTVGAPLSFLDHHLRWGNSLIGSDVRTVEAAIQRTASGQFGLFAGPFAGLLDLTGVMIQIAEQADSTLADVRRSAEDFARFQLELTPYKQVLDLWVSQYFGNKPALEFLTLYGEQVLPALEGKQAVSEPYRAAIEGSRALWREKRFFHWDLEFPEVFVDLERRDWAQNPGFDVVIGNPPYENAWTMTSLENTSRQAIVALNNASDLLRGHWDLWAAFFARALYIVREGGSHSFIVPDAFAREKYALEVRRSLLQSTTLRRLMHFEGVNVFDEVSRHCLIYVLDRTIPEADVETQVDTPVGAGKEAIEVGKIKQSEWLLGEGFQIRVSLADPRKWGLIRRIESDSIRIGQFCYVMVGATTHSKDKVSFVKSSIVTSEPVGNAKPFFDGKNLSRYEIASDGRYLDYRRDEMYGPRVPELFESAKVVVRDVTGVDEQLIVSYDDTGLYCDHLVTCITYYENVASARVQTEFGGFPRVQPPYPGLPYLTSILASKLMTWYFREVFATGTLQGSYSHTYPQQVRALPILRITFTTPAADRARYADKGRRLYEQFCTKADYACVLGFVEHHLAQGQSDVVHDLLAFLAEQMIDMNKAKQVEVKGFLTWLSREIGAAIEALANKTRLQNYLGDYQKDEPPANLEDVLAVLRQNRRKLSVDPSARAFQERLQAEYDASLATLLPLKQRLAATDRLIDQVVYRLYGLTEDEIAVVEGQRE